MRWFLLDRLEECEPGIRAVGTKVFSLSELFFMDHFPGNPVVPGVLEIEMIAQTASRCIRLARHDIRTMLSNVRSARFIKPIRPGDQCRISIEILKMRSQYALSAGVITVAESKVGEAELVLAAVPRTGPVATDPILEDWVQRQGGIVEQHSLAAGVATFAK